MPELTIPDDLPVEDKTPLYRLRPWPGELDILGTQVFFHCAKLYMRKVVWAETRVKEPLTGARFLEEYAWVVYTSGFNARIVAKKWVSLTKCWDRFDPAIVGGHNSSSQVNLNFVLKVPKKHYAIGTVARLMSQTAVALYEEEVASSSTNTRQDFNPFRPSSSYLNPSYPTAKHSGVFQGYSYDKFFLLYCGSVEALDTLPRIGPVNRYHLARNLGIGDAVKPDLHLMRIARAYAMSSPDILVDTLRCNQYLSNYRRGTIDLMLWLYSLDYGTKEL